MGGTEKAGDIVEAVIPDRFRHFLVSSNCLGLPPISVLPQAPLLEIWSGRRLNQQLKIFQYEKYQTRKNLFALYMLPDLNKVGGTPKPLVHASH